MFAKPALPWTWLTVKSKCLGSGLFAIRALPWTWLTIQLSALGLACLSDTRYLKLG